MLIVVAVAVVFALPFAYCISSSFGEYFFFSLLTERFFFFWIFEYFCDLLFIFYFWISMATRKANTHVSVSQPDYADWTRIIQNLSRIRWNSTNQKIIYTQFLMHDTHRNMPTNTHMEHGQRRRRRRWRQTVWILCSRPKFLPLLLNIYSRFYGQTEPTISDPRR